MIGKVRADRPRDWAGFSGALGCPAPEEREGAESLQPAQTRFPILSGTLGRGALCERITAVCRQIPGDPSNRKDRRGFWSLAMRKEGRISSREG